MEANAFVKEVYRRMALRHAAQVKPMPWSEMQNQREVKQAVFELRPLLPASKDAAILDIGFGGGWFLAACLKLGYQNLYGADFGIANKSYVREWGNGASIHLSEIEEDIGSHLANQAERFDFIHMSHVIEHIPKYSLLWVVDALYRALKHDGTLMLRTPNMEGPCANSSLYVTLAHEYGFVGSNLESLLDICGFDEIRLHRPKSVERTIKQRAGDWLRGVYLRESKVRHRLFGVNRGGVYGRELLVTARRGRTPPLFDPKYQ